jgi:hypothetical protein
MERIPLLVDIVHCAENLEGITRRAGTPEFEFSHVFPITQLICLSSSSELVHVHATMLTWWAILCMCDL